ncbi:MAG: DUF433 domain-containing protein [Thermodesulfovibrionales bacterium]
MATTIEYRYVVSDKKILGGEPVIRGTRTPVRAIVENWRLGLSPEEIVIHMPHLKLAQIFEALSYYSDHQKEINKYIEKNQVPEDKIHSALK